MEEIGRLGGLGNLFEWDGHRLSRFFCQSPRTQRYIVQQIVATGDLIVEET
jgi:hypothetical protein